jgi:hypothetical protein
MRSIAISRPSPAFVVALLALFVALGGTGYAAVTINGASIRPHTIVSNRLKPNTLTGGQINEAKLGTVPSATHASGADTAGHAASADHATSADTALHAISADNAGSAQDAKTLAGHAPADFASSRTRVVWTETQPVNGVGGVADAKVFCAGNAHAISGGGEWLTASGFVAVDSVTISQSVPLGFNANGEDARLSGWEIRGENSGGNGAMRILRAYVVCAPDNA